MSPDLVMPPSARIETFFFAAPRARDVKGSHLRNADSGHDARRANRTRPLADLDGVRAAVGKKFHARRAGDIAGDEGQFREGVAQYLYRVAYALAVAVRGRDRHHIHAAFDERPDVVENAVAVQFAERVARGRDRRAADEVEMGVAGRLELRVAFLRDALDVAHGDESLQLVVVVHHQQFVDADVFGEKFVGPGNRVLAQIPFS